MKLNSWRQKIYILAIFNCIQFLILTNLAMFFYPGGTFSDPNTVGYSFFQNLFSDLGRYIAHSGDSNLISFLIYNISLFLMGVLFILYFFAFPRFFIEKGKGKGYSIAGSLLGIGISISMVGASLTPADLLYFIHVSFGFFKFMALLPLVIFYTIAILQNKSYHNFYAIVFIIFGVLQFIFLLIMSFGASEHEVSMVFAAGQNIAVNAMTICFLIQAYGAWKMHKSLISKD